MKKLVIHIGTGKTGTTAIQEHLLSIHSTLAERRVHYWGLNLDLAPKETIRTWQTQEGTSLLQSMPLDTARYEVGSALHEALLSLEDRSVAIWSNESIYENADLYIPILREAELKHGVEIFVIAYARNALTYLQSAYKQWGVMHKTYQGPVAGFTEWTSKNHAFLSYGGKLSLWDKAFSNSFTLVNYDFADDSLKDFMARIPGCGDLISSSVCARENASPSAAMLALYALYNSQFEDEVYPHAMMSLFSGNAIGPSVFPAISLAKLFPTQDEIIAVAALFKEDQELVNIILARNGQPLLSESRLKQNNGTEYREIDILKAAVATLTAISVEQENRIKALEGQVSLLKS